MNAQEVNKKFGPVPVELEEIAKKTVDAAYIVHKNLGPGLMESVYETCLKYELRNKGLRVESQVILPIYYRGIRIDSGLRLDLIVENSLIVEIKTVETLLPVHKAKILSYLKLSGHRLGLLINFNSALIKDGINRVIL
jgi:GxxExxY protein